MKRCKNYINGAWTESVSGNAAPTFNPATGEELAQVVVSTPEDVDRAVAAAHTSFYETREWRDMDSQTRGDFLLRIADLIAEAREEHAYPGRGGHGKAPAGGGGGCGRRHPLLPLLCGPHQNAPGGQLWRERPALGRCIPTPSMSRWGLWGSLPPGTTPSSWGPGSWPRRWPQGTA